MKTKPKTNSQMSSYKRLFYFRGTRMNLQVALYLVITFLISPFALGQNLLHDHVQDEKNNGTAFQEISAFDVSSRRYSQPSDFLDLSSVKLLNYRLDLSTLNSTAISFPIPLGNRMAVLDLVEVPDTFYDYQLRSNTGEQYSPNRDGAKHYRGVIRGDQNSIVAISFFEEDAMGVISNSEGNFNLGKLRNSDDFIIYNDAHLSAKPDMECSTEDSETENYREEVLYRKPPQQIRAFETNCVGLYFETEYDIYQNFGSIVGVENYVTALYNQVATLYMNEGIDTTISMINVWTSADPYTATNTASLLTQFQTNTGAFTGDLGQLLTFRNVGGGRAAGFAGICNPNSDLSLSVSGNLTSTVVSVPTYSWNVMVVTHEFGHLFGSRHTHACVWNGNNTAIDTCAGFVEGTCPYPGPGIPANGGTIMSYCHIQAVGINFTLGFGQQPGNVIRDNVANGVCLGTCSPCPVTTNPFDLYTKDRPFDMGFEPNPDTGPMWISEDIWVRKSLDGGTTPENPEFKLYEPNGVYVRVKNNGATTSDCAVLKVYFSKASTGLQWPTHFNNYYQMVGANNVLHGDIIGTAIIPSLTPGADTVIELPWYPPNPGDFINDIHHFCLVSRILSDNDPMYNEVAGNISPNVRDNNNIAWKNLSVYNLNPNDLPPPASVFIRGVVPSTRLVNIRFFDRGFDEEVTMPFFEVGTVIVDIERDLYEVMIQNGCFDVPGIEIIGDNKVMLTSPEAYFRRVPLDYNKTFSLGFQFKTNEPLEEEAKVLFDVIQEDFARREYQGGERFLLTSKKKKDTQSKTNIAFNFVIVPNPNKGIFDIQMDKVMTGSYSVLDINGAEIMQGDFANSSKVTLKIESLNQGIYFIKVISEKEQVTQLLVRE